MGRDRAEHQLRSRSCPGCWEPSDREVPPSASKRAVCWSMGMLGRRGWGATGERPWRPASDTQDRRAGATAGLEGSNTPSDRNPWRGSGKSWGPQAEGLELGGVREGGPCKELSPQPLVPQGSHQPLNSGAAGDLVFSECQIIGHSSERFQPQNPEGPGQPPRRTQSPWGVLSGDQLSPAPPCGGSPSAGAAEAWSSAALCWRRWGTAHPAPSVPPCPSSLCVRVTGSREPSPSPLA